MTRRQENKIRTRKAILKAAVSAFAARGVTAATMDEIAENAGIARATLFKYFPSKAEIVAASVEQMDEDLISQIDRHAAMDLPVGERIVALFTSNGAQLEAHREAIRPLAAISQEGWSQERGAERTRRLVSAFERLSEGGAQGAALGEVLAGTYLGIIRNWQIHEDYSVAEHLEAAARLIARAV